MGIRIDALLTAATLSVCFVVSCGGDGKKSGSGGDGDSGGSGGSSVGGSSNGGSSNGGSSNGGSSNGGSSNGGSSNGGSSNGGSSNGGSSNGGSSGADGGTGGSGGAQSTGGGGGSSGSGGGGTGGVTGTGGSAGEPSDILEVTVSPEVDRKTISPLIYGMQGAEAGLESGAKLVRLGGSTVNDVSGYNWEVNATHLGDNFSFSNASLGSGNAGAAPAAVLEAASANAGAAMLTIPMGPLVAADADPGDVRDTSDYLTTRFRSNLAQKGAAFVTDPNTADAYVYQDEFVNWVMTNAGSTPVVFALGNHPSLWDAELSLIHSEKANYDDVVNLGVEFSKAIKDVWPTAETSGPASYGWQSYLDLQGSPDADTEGEFLDYYLSQMASAETDDGRRLLDYLDLHWWPEVYAGYVRIIEEDSSPEVAAARMAAPRSLWDPSYNENSWVNYSAGGPLDLVHRMQTKIQDTYPGTKLAISAWYYGGGSHISGAIAAADVLGIFGREQVDLASASPPEASPFVHAAFQVYLNYDGAGARFGDTSVAVSANDVAEASAYASIESSNESRVVVVLINKRDVERDANIEIVSETSYSSCLVVELTETSPTLRAADTLTATASNEFDYTMPPLSVSVLVPQG